MIDSGLTWQAQIDNVSKKISRSVGLLYKIRPFVNKHIIKMLYYSLVFSHLTYAVEVWGSADNSHLNRLLILQKRAVRILSHCEKRSEDYYLTPSNPLFFKMEIHKIHDIFKIRLAKFIFTSLNKSNPINFHSWFKLIDYVHNYNTRSRYIDIDNSITTRTIFVPFARTTYYGLKLTKVLGSKLWNNLPPRLRVNNITLTIFIKNLKKHLIDSYEHQ